MSTTLYCIGTWDTDAQAFTPHPGCDWYGLTRRQLVEVMRELQECGYTCHRVRDRDHMGQHTGDADSDVSVLIERVNGRTPEQVLIDWER